MSQDPEVVGRRLKTMQLIVAAEKVLAEAEEQYDQLRTLLAELRALHHSETP